LTGTRWTLSLTSNRQFRVSCLRLFRLSGSRLSASRPGLSRLPLLERVRSVPQGVKSPFWEADDCIVCIIHDALTPVHISSLTSYSSLTIILFIDNIFNRFRSYNKPWTSPGAASRLGSGFVLEPAQELQARRPGLSLDHRRDVANTNTKLKLVVTSPAGQGRSRWSRQVVHRPCFPPSPFPALRPLRRALQIRRY
jgi:hypothetical protein